MKRPEGRAPAVLVPPLLDWFFANARDLPWRRTFDPYAVWVSEIMLQQTQVKTVIPYYERWMKQLPDVAALANATPEKIHKLWEGLGYYTRVRNMQKAAQQIVARHNGEFPRAFDEVLELPGIGRYTAGAICSIAFNASTPILDGNVIRVLTRLFGIRENVRDKETDARLWKLAQELVSAANDPTGRKVQLANGQLTGRCSALNQSLMELGALVCTPRQPCCDLCPLAGHCVAQRDELTEELPNLDARVPATARRFLACVLEHDGKFFVRQRPVGVVNAHLWEFPNVEVAVRAGEAQALRSLELELGGEFASVAPLTTVKHTITRYRITLEVVRGAVRGGALPGRSGQWTPKNACDLLPFTSAHRRVLRAALASTEGR